MFSDESVELNDLSLDLLTSLLEKKPMLSLSFTECLSQEAKKAGDQQMSPCIHVHYLEHIDDLYQ